MVISLCRIIPWCFWNLKLSSVSRCNHKTSSRSVGSCHWCKENNLPVWFFGKLFLHTFFTYIKIYGKSFACILNLFLAHAGCISISPKQPICGIVTKLFEPGNIIVRFSIFFVYFFTKPMILSVYATTCISPMSHRNSCKWTFGLNSLGQICARYFAKVACY